MLRTAGIVGILLAGASPLGADASTLYKPDGKTKYPDDNVMQMGAANDGSHSNWIVHEDTSCCLELDAWHDDRSVPDVYKEQAFGDLENMRGRGVFPEEHGAYNYGECAMECDKQEADKDYDLNSCQWGNDIGDEETRWDKEAFCEAKTNDNDKVLGWTMKNGGCDIVTYPGGGGGESKAKTVMDEYGKGNCLACKKSEMKKNGGQSGMICSERMKNNPCEPYWTTATIPCMTFDSSSYCADQKDAGGPKCLPGLEFVGRAFDITSDSTDPDKLPRNRKPMVIATNYDMVSPKRKSIGDETYLVTGNVEVDPEYSASTTSSAKNYKDFNSYKKDRAASLNIEGTYGVAEGSAAMKGADSVAASLESNKQFTEFTNNFPKFSIRKKPSIVVAPEMMGLIASPINAVMKGWIPPDVFLERMFKIYGTHVVSQVTMGGRLVIETSADACKSTKEVTKEIEAEVCASGTAASGNSAGGCAAASQATEDKSEKESSSSTCNLLVEGGDTGKCKAGSCGGDMCDNDAWTASLESKKARLSPLSFQLTPITDVFATNGAPSEVVDMMKEYIKKKIEAAASSASNPTVDTSACGGSTSPKDQVEGSADGATAPRASLLALAVATLATVWAARAARP